MRRLEADCPFFMMILDLVSELHGINTLQYEGIGEEDKCRLSQHDGQINMASFRLYSQTLQPEPSKFDHPVVNVQLADIC